MLICCLFINLPAKALSEYNIAIDKEKMRDLFFNDEPMEWQIETMQHLEKSLLLVYITGQEKRKFAELLRPLGRGSSDVSQQ